MKVKIKKRVTIIFDLDEKEAAHKEEERYLIKNYHINSESMPTDDERGYIELIYTNY